MKIRDESLPKNVLPYSHNGFIASLNTVYSTFLDSATSSNRYIELVNNLHDTLIPFGTNGIEDKIYDVNVGSRKITAIIENNESLNSYVNNGNGNISVFSFYKKHTYQNHTIINLEVYKMTHMKRCTYKI